MPTQLFLTEIFSSPLFLSSSAIPALDNIIRSIVGGTFSEKEQNGFRKYASVRVLSSSMQQLDEMPDSAENPFDHFPDDSIAIISIIGTMFKYGYWWRPGCDDMANLIRLADQSDRITGTILLFNTPGGSVDSIIQLEDALRNRKKKCIALVDNLCLSGGMYAASFADEIHATHPICEFGSIGVLTRFVNTSAADEKFGYKIEEIYPPESKYKNLPEREAYEGKPERMVKERLSPLAIHFQDTIKKNRPNLNQETEGILQGKVFYSLDALSAGLIDGIMNLDQAVARLRSIDSDQKTIYSLYAK